MAEPTRDRPEADDVAVEEGGEPACLLHELCPDCGAVPEAGSSACWRCGAPR